MNRKERYIKEKTDALFQHWLTKVCTVGGVFFLALSILDFLYSPERFLEFLIYRSTFAFTLFVIGYLGLKIYKPNLHRILAVFSVAISAVGIEILILSFGAQDSGYWPCMIILAILTMGFFPASMAHHITYAAVIYLIYSLPILYLFITGEANFPENYHSHEHFILANIFLLASLAALLTLRYFSWKNLLQELALNFELEHQREELEETVEEKTRSLKETVEKLREEIFRREATESQLQIARDNWQETFDTINEAITIHDANYNIIQCNKAATTLLRLSENTVLSQKCYKSYHQKDSPPQHCPSCQSMYTGLESVNEIYEPSIGKHLEVKALPRFDHRNNLIGIVHIVRDIDERKRAELAQKRLELQLHQAHKLEAVGSLAAGIAHEVNTPTQYIGDNIQFLKDSFKTITDLLEKYKRLAAKYDKAIVEQIKQSCEEGDIDYLIKEIPKAIDQSFEGNTRVAEIVRSMKEFAHPGNVTKEPTDINKAIASTISVTTNEWKYVADIDTDFDSSLSCVNCYAGEFNQVILNMIVNAAHAIKENNAAIPGSGKGVITITTRRRNNLAEIRISDTGIGISEDIQPRIFEPFFTTKAVGKGTGQGLAIAREVIVERHQGSLALESLNGRGATFIINIPLS